MGWPGLAPDYLHLAGGYMFCPPRQPLPLL